MPFLKIISYFFLLFKSILLLLLSRHLYRPRDFLNIGGQKLRLKFNVGCSANFSSEKSKCFCVVFSNVNLYILDIAFLFFKHLFSCIKTILNLFGDILIMLIEVYNHMTKCSTCRCLSIQTVNLPNYNNVIQLHTT